MWGFVFLGSIHGYLFLTFFFAVIKKIKKSKCLDVGLFTYIRTFTALSFAISAFMAYFETITFSPIPYVLVSLIPFGVYSMPLNKQQQIV